MQTMRHIIEWIATGIELLAVAVIVGAILSMALPRGKSSSDPSPAGAELSSARKQRMGRGLLLALELMLAADIVATVALRPTLQSLAALGLLALIRSFLSWSLDVEINGCWPWRVRAERRATENVRSVLPAQASVRE